MSHAAHDLGAVFPEDRALLQRLKTADGRFARLAEDYARIDRAIHRAEQDLAPTDDAHLAGMRTERVRLLDEIAQRLRMLAAQKVVLDQ